MTDPFSSVLLMLFGAVAGAMLAMEYGKSKAKKTVADVLKESDGDPFVRVAYLSYSDTLEVVAAACNVTPSNSAGPYQLCTLDDGSKMLIYRIKKIDGNVVRLEA